MPAPPHTHTPSDGYYIGRQETLAYRDYDLDLYNCHTCGTTYAIETPKGSPTPPLGTTQEPSPEERLYGERIPPSNPSPQ